MYHDVCKIGLLCAFLFVVHQGMAQSIVFAPAAPTTDDTEVATLSEPFNCAAQPPELTVVSADALTFSSTLPSGIVNCPVIPFPPPTTSSFPVSLGSLLAGTYTVTWNIYLAQSSGSPTLQSSTSATLVVTPGAIASVAITPGFTGNWYDPDQSGHGFSLEVLPGNVLLAEWFVFAPYGGQAWVVATGPITGNSAVLQGFYTSGAGGLFPPKFDSSQLHNQPWGTITFTFTDCNHGKASWLPTATAGYGYTGGSIPISRLTMPAGLSCP